jgi:hypothetical protein
VPVLVPVPAAARASFGDAYESIVAVAARPHHAARVAEMRRVFEERTGHFGNADFEPRTRAFWDDALTRQGFARDARAELDEAAATWVPGLGRAHRGLFRAEVAFGKRVLHDVWGGASFLVDVVDEASQDAVDAASAPFDARLAARAEDGIVAMLPGAIFHPAEAAAPMDKVLTAARARSLGTDDVLDALLRMELSLRTLSRVKPAYAYRPEALAAASAARPPTRPRAV